MNVPPVMRLMLTGQDNSSYVGTLYLHNASASLDGLPSPVDGRYRPRSHAVFSRGSGTAHSAADPNGATYYVVAVVLVYGFSIVLLIASHIKRKNAKALEDRQINKYLQEFQVASSHTHAHTYTSEYCRSTRPSLTLFRQYLRRSILVRPLLVLKLEK